ncbi:mechanosensitive ion channel family protein [Rhodocytophaga aerolata]|uniref:Mechanosensitive ion channel family protein n=1 Tax=Rhodocytophaga aerolata TaxID=455078 RepID=A0ABT8R920_9BACT|nr:mechanosensitive ion channel family protein [Rhodocytophaga aerolata]MDO1447267.1 mechanosensitive ion channel family protein [Rhodocytophaga aerolata]
MDLFENVNWALLVDQIIRWLIVTLPSIVLIILLGVLALRFWNILVRKFKFLLLKRALKGDPANVRETEKRVETLLGIISLVGKIAILIIVGLIILRKVDIEIGPIIASLGIFGLAVGFGAQELVRDVVTGFFILLENHIRTGDVAIINGTSGLVEEISLRTIILRDQSGTIHVFQNGKINTLSNMTKGWSAAVFDIGVAYKENTDEVSRVMERVADTLLEDPEFKDKILQPIELLGVDSFGTNAVMIKARIKTLPSHQWAIGREYRRRLKLAFDEKGIEIPFPHSTIYWGDDTKPLQVKLIEQKQE